MKCKRLNEVIELVADPKENGLVAMPLEIASLAADFWLCGEILDPSLAEVDNPLFTDFHILSAVDVERFRQSLLDCMTFRFKVMPDNKMVVRILVDNFHLPFFQAVSRIP